MAGAIEASITPISTHAPRTGSDASSESVGVSVLISTHAPRTGSDKTGARPEMEDTIFQPTLPARGATSVRLSTMQASSNFNPRSPHGERHELFTIVFSDMLISTHAPRTGSDGSGNPRHQCASHFNPRSPHGERPRKAHGIAYRVTFQPTLPARGATSGRRFVHIHQAISTHAPRTGSDTRIFVATFGAINISTHAPRTGSDRAADDQRVAAVGISTHAPRTGSDRRVTASLSSSRNFNPRSPHGERHAFAHVRPFAERISTHAPRTGSDSRYRLTA